MPKMKDHYVEFEEEKSYLENKVDPIKKEIDDTLSLKKTKTDYARVVVNAIKLQERWIDKCLLDTPHEAVMNFRKKVDQLEEVKSLHGKNKIEDIDKFIESFRGVVRRNLSSKKLDATPEQRVENVKTFLLKNLGLEEEEGFISKKIDKLVKQTLVQETFKEIYDDSEIPRHVYEYLS